MALSWATSPAYSLVGGGGGAAEGGYPRTGVPGGGRLGCELPNRPTRRFHLESEA